MLEKEKFPQDYFPEVGHAAGPASPCGSFPGRSRQK